MAKLNRTALSQGSGAFSHDVLIPASIAGEPGPEPQVALVLPCGLQRRATRLVPMAETSGSRSDATAVENAWESIGIRAAGPQPEVAPNDMRSVRTARP
jgi:hypothetical protein